MAKQEHYFEEDLVAGLIKEWLTTRNDETFAAILLHSTPLIKTLMSRFPKGDAYSDSEDIFSKVCLKLLRALPHYDPARGRAYSFLTTVVRRYLIEISIVWQQAAFEAGHLRGVEFYDTIPPEPPEPAIALEDRRHFLAAFRVASPEPERAFLVDYFCETGHFPSIKALVEGLGLKKSGWQNVRLGSLIRSFREELKSYLLARRWPWHSEWRWQPVGCLPGYPRQVKWNDDWRWRLCPTSAR